MTDMMGSAVPLGDDGNPDWGARTGRGKWPNTPGGRRRQRIQDVREQMPSVYNKDGSESFGRNRRRFEGAVARSTMPAGDLSAVNEVHLTRANQSALAQYDINSRNIEVPTRKGESLKRDTPEDKTLLAHSIIHETGHALDRNLNPDQFFPLKDKARMGRNEAVADNYADKHTRGYGGEPGDKYSTYDAAVAVHLQRKNTGGYAPIKNNFGKKGVETYQGFRKLGLTPADPAPPEHEVNQKLKQPWFPNTKFF